MISLYLRYSYFWGVFRVVNCEHINFFPHQRVRHGFVSRAFLLHYDEFIKFRLQNFRLKLTVLIRAKLFKIYLPSSRQSIMCTNSRKKIQTFIAFSEQSPLTQKYFSKKHERNPSLLYHSAQFCRQYHHIKRYFRSIEKVHTVST